ncbi:MAG: 6,7-dimethyl-8-ribityllumazine synthase [Candidatus Gracilibacteria bacterium]|nr:6,7-dimethyl-8-ribityllumazine synthase [Candidatus Gracilibacteria bacterium]
MIAIVASKFNEMIVNRLVKGAEQVLKKHKVTFKTYYVPGAFELPLAAKKLSKKYDAVICLGAVIRGETPHFEYVSAETARGIMQVGLESMKPILFGVITAENARQAEKRSGKTNNKGIETAEAALVMLDFMRKS